jgi:hypothetical protein
MTIKFRRKQRRPIVTIVSGCRVFRILMDRDDAQCLLADMEDAQ